MTTFLSIYTIGIILDIAIFCFCFYKAYNKLPSANLNITILFTAFFWPLALVMVICYFFFPGVLKRVFGDSIKEAEKRADAIIADEVD